MDESSHFTHGQDRLDGMELVTSQGATCDGYRVKLYGKLHFLKRLKPQFSGDIRYREALRKEFETGYCLEHPNLVRYITLESDSILMEYVDGETLTQRLERQPEYFYNRKHTDKFIHQLLDVMGYLHSHQVLHLDLKPDNILLTRIGDDLKLIDLGCCLTDTFADTPGCTPTFAAPEQLPSDEEASSQLPSHQSDFSQLPSHQKVSPQFPSHEEASSQLPSHQSDFSQLPSHQSDFSQLPSRQKVSPQLPSHHRGGAGVGCDVRTDIYAIGRILQLLPHTRIYNKVIARCTAPNKADRFPSVQALAHAVTATHRHHRLWLFFPVVVAALLTVLLLWPHRPDNSQSPLSLPPASPHETEITPDVVLSGNIEQTVRPADTVQSVKNVTPSLLQGHGQQQVPWVEVESMLKHSIDSLIALTILVNADSPLANDWYEAHRRSNDIADEVIFRYRKEYPYHGGVILTSGTDYFLLWRDSIFQHRVQLAKPEN